MDRPMNSDLYPQEPPSGYYKAQPSMVVTTEPSLDMVPQLVYKDYLALSIMSMICCCLPLGVAALIFSIQTRDAASRQDAVSAAKNSRAAFTLNMVALGVGLCLHILWIAYIVYLSKYYG